MDFKRKLVFTELIMKRYIKLLLNRLLPKSNYRFVMKQWQPLFDLKACAQILETKRFTRNMQTQVVDVPEAKTIAIISPHPDDDIFGAGGTVRKASKQGSQSHSIYITDIGDTPEQNQAIHKEITEACHLIQSTPHFLCMPSNHIPLTKEEPIAALTATLNEIKPDVLFIPFLLDDHDDHRRVNEVLITIADQIKNPPKEVWAYQIYSSIIPNVVVDITEQVENKEKAMRLLQSVKGERDWAHYVLGMNAMNCRFLPTRNTVYGETFFVVPWQEYLDLCQQYFSHGAEQVYYNPVYRAESLR